MKNALVSMINLNTTNIIGTMCVCVFVCVCMSKNSYTLIQSNSKKILII